MSHAIGFVVYALAVVMLLAGADNAGTLASGNVLVTALIINLLAVLLGYIAHDAARVLLHEQA